MAAICVVVWGSLLPADSPLLETVDRLQISDKVCHFCAYVLLSLLAATAQKTRRRSVFAALLMGVLGLALEILQGFTPTRSMDLVDAMASWLGVACGMLLGLALVRTATALEER